jgi:hypothetical protein
MWNVRAWIFLTARFCVAATAWLLLIFLLGALGILGNHQTELALVGVLVVAVVMWRTPRAYRRLPR